MESSTLTEPAVLFTDEELQAAELRAYQIAGYVKVDKEGTTIKDTDALKTRVFEVVTARVASSRADMAAKSLTQGELYAAAFPAGPGADPKRLISDLPLLEQAVRAKLVRTVWALTNPDRKGAIQSRLGKEGRSEVLIRTKVQRGVDEIMGVFITDDPKLIMEESVQPMVEKLYNVAKEVRLHNDIVIEARHPELAGSVMKILDVARKRVNAELTRPANGTAALPPAVEAERGGEG